VLRTTALPSLRAGGVLPSEQEQRGSQKSKKAKKQKSKKAKKQKSKKAKKQKSKKESPILNI
jgi:hypothetical protein